MASVAHGSGERINVREDYDAFLRAKITPGVVFDGDYAIIPQWTHAEAKLAEEIDQHAPHLHEYQRFAVTFCVARRRAAVFAECGLGKTSIALAWASHVADGPVVICAPLAALHEFERERDKFFPSLQMQVVKTGQFDEWLANPSGIALVTHHAFVQRRDLSMVEAFVLDESSILKSGDGAIAGNLVQSCKPAQWRLALSATPAPNDPTEYATHSTWLGYMRTDAEFRARFFIHDGKDWRPKRHAAKELPRWLSRFALWMRDPATYGMPCNKAIPDPYQRHVVKIETPDDAEELVERDLFGQPVGMMTMSARAKIRGSLYADDARGDEVSKIVSGHPAVVWAMRNAHADELEKSLRAAGVNVAQISGATDDDERVRIVRAFQSGDLDCIVSKPKVIGHGVNLQRCERMVFAGYDESYEAMHQAIRRAHRQGRTGSLQVYLIATPDEQLVIESLDAKADRWNAEADRQEHEFSIALHSDVEAYRKGIAMSTEIDTTPRMDTAISEWFELHNGDSLSVMDTFEENSFDLTVFSPPFASLYTYSSEQADMGNCSSHGYAEFNLHFRHFAERLLRVMKPGRICCLHLSQLTYVKSMHGRKGLQDFRGRIISAMEDCGWWYFGEFVVPKNPQAQAIRTKTDRLQFSQFHRNSLESSPALNDYILEFKKPGDPECIVQPDVSNDEWINWASGLWGDIRETDVLSGWMSARGEEDEKHICPLQLTVIDRCVRLWTNPGETVFTPFLGIGSEVYQSILRGRRGVGVELKPEYFVQAVRNCERAVAETYGQLSLFDAEDVLA